MKYLFFYFLFLSGTAYCQQFSINGKASFLANGDTVWVRMANAGLTNKPMPALIKNGEFQVVFAVQTTERYDLTYHQNRAVLFLDPKNTTVNLVDTTLQHVIVTNNHTNDEWNTFIEIMAKDADYNGFMIERGKWYRAGLYQTPDKEVQRKEKIRLDSLLILRKVASIKNAVNWVKTHPESQINSFVLLNYTTGSNNKSAHMPEAELKELYNSLPDVAKQNTWSKQLEDHLNGLILGGHAPDFAQLDPSGKTVHLSDFKGKYVLLDFWASWCTPCRAENPNVVKAYQQYHDHNFVILSVSLDNKKDAWLSAIEHDGMPWNHVSDLNRWQNVVSKQYDVHSIPANFLIDPNGVIVAKNLTGDKLQQTLKKLLK